MDPKSEERIVKRPVRYMAMECYPGDDNSRFAACVKDRRVGPYVKCLPEMLSPDTPLVYWGRAPGARLFSDGKIGFDPQGVSLPMSGRENEFCA